MFTVPFNSIKTPKFIAQLTNVFFCYCQIIKCFHAPSSFRMCRDQITEYSSESETVLCSSRNLGGAPEHLIDGSEKHTCWLSFEF